MAMKRLGLLDMLQLAAGFSMAGPMFFLGLSFLQAGELVGGVAFLALGAFALYFPTYLVNRIGGPRAWIRRRFSGSEGDDEPANTERSSPFDRFRRR